MIFQMADDGVSAVIRQFNDCLDEFEKLSPPAGCVTSNPEGATTCDNCVEDSEEQDSIDDKEWKSFLQNGIGKPCDQPTNHNDDGGSHGDTNVELNTSGCHSNCDVLQSKTDGSVLERLTKYTRTRESILVSEAFNFLPSYEEDGVDLTETTKIDSENNQNSTTNTEMPPCVQQTELTQDNCKTDKNVISQSTGTAETNDKTVEDELPSEPTCTDDNTVLNQSEPDSILRNKQSQEQIIEQEQRLVSQAFQFIKDLEIDEVQKLDEVQSGVDIRETRVISAAFKFLAAEEASFNEQQVDKKLSTVQEGWF
jgi:hypothetical protein